MSNNWVFIAYYIFAVFVVGLFSYAVFWLDKSAWWFVMVLILLNISPTVKNKEKNEERDNTV